MFLLSYNNFNFENLAYAKTKVLDNFQYSPQKLAFVDTVYVQPNASMNLTVDDGNYQEHNPVTDGRKMGSGYIPPLLEIRQ